MGLACSRGRDGADEGKRDFPATGEGERGEDVLARLWNQNGNSKYLLMACLILYTCLRFLWRCIFREH